MAELIAFKDSGKINSKIAKDVFEKMYRSGDTAQAIVAREGLTQVADEGALGAAVDRVLGEHAKVVDDFGPERGPPWAFCRSGDEVHAGQGESGRGEPIVVEKIRKDG